MWEWFLRAARVIRTATVDPSQVDSAAARRARARGLALEERDAPPKISRYQDGKRHLHIADKRGAAFDYCASLDHRYLCCGVHVLRALSNCPYDCSYCFLQSYLTDATTSVVADIDALIADIRAAAAREPRRFFRVGTWELGDSLALEPETGTAAELVRAFAEIPYAVLELKTKSDHVEGLLELDHRGRTVVSWTLSPPAITRLEERRTASLAQRLRNSGEIVETNAITHLDLYAQALPVAIEESLEEFRDLFGAYTLPAVGQT